MIPVRYWPLHSNSLPLDDRLNSGNFMFWHPHPPPYSTAPKGWVKHVKRHDKSYALMPHSTYDLIRGTGVKRFLRRRALLLPRTGGEFLVWLKTYEPTPSHPHYEFALGIAHYRHRGPSTHIVDFDAQKDLPEAIQKWFPAELPERQAP